MYGAANESVRLLEGVLGRTIRKHRDAHGGKAKGGMYPALDATAHPSTRAEASGSNPNSTGGKAMSEQPFFDKHTMKALWEFSPEIHHQVDSLRSQLTASQERERKMREMLSSAVCNDCRNSKVIRYSDGSLSPCPWCERRRQALSTPSDAGRGGWQPIETAPKDGTNILIADIDDGTVFDVLNGRFEVLEDDEEDGPWDIRDGEPWCSYIGREAGTYFCHWLPGKEWDNRTLFTAESGYTHWMPAPLPTQPAKEGGLGE
jgi:hypothetical protein